MLTPSQKRPLNIEVDLKQTEVRITWADGVTIRYPLEYLRKICPCATCDEERNNDDPLRVLSPSAVSISTRLEADHPAEMVGNYAMQFFWDDGHRTGIYTFEFLRQNAPN
jgi:DUF971 family protein